MKLIKTLLKKICLKLPLNRIILFESRPDLSDNTLGVFNKMIEFGLNKRYKLIWLCYDEFVSPKYRLLNVKYLNVNKHRLMALYYLYFSKAIVCCNRFVGTYKKGQLSFYLMHGAPIKKTTSFYSCPDFIDWMITPSEGMKIPSAIDMGIDIKKCVALGFPRNDVLLEGKINLHPFFGDYKKIIAWYPTVKQYDNGFSLGDMSPISLIHSEEDAVALNNYLKNKGVILAIKLHFAQSKSFFLNNYSNIVILNEGFFKQNGIMPYSFLASVDGLLSDYSSVFYDFMLCDKPIGLIWEDIDLFKKALGFIDGYETYTSGCEKIYSFDDLKGFISRVIDGVDILRDKRNEICDLSNYARDGLNSQRVCEFIMNLLSNNVEANRK